MNKNLTKRNEWLCFVTFLVTASLHPLLKAEERQGLVINTGLLFKNDSNITRTAEKIPDKKRMFSPQLQFLSNLDQHKLLINYQGDFAGFSDRSQYNYNSHDIKVQTILDHSYRLNSEFTFGYEDQVEEPGINDAQILVENEFNTFKRKTAQGKLYYGTDASTGQFIVGVEQAQTRYTNNMQSFRDLDLNKLTGTFFYRVAPKTRILIEASSAQFDYTENALISLPNSDEKLYLTGVEWKATAITSGTFKIGYQERDFAGAQFSDLDGLSYFLDMLWQPNAYTNIKIGAQRASSESAQQGIGGFISKGYSFNLEHSLSRRINLTIAYQSDEADFKNIQDRTDRRKNIILGITNSLRSWLEISINYRHIARSSREQIFTFSSDSVELSLKTKFD